MLSKLFLVISQWQARRAQAKRIRALAERFRTQTNNPVSRAELDKATEKLKGEMGNWISWHYIESTQTVRRRDKR
jgi:hypothetical protein